MKLKKLFLMTSIIFAVALFSRITASAETRTGACGIDGDNVTWSFNETTGVLTFSGTGAMKDFEKDYDEGEYWASQPWSYNLAFEKVKTVIIENGITNIGDYAFVKHINLTSISIPNTCADIGKLVFYRCKNLKTITLPEGVTSITEDCFEQCTGLTKINIPSTLTEISDGAFWGCYNLTDVTIANGITSIGAGAFYNCDNLTNITIPKSVVSIGNSAFWGCNIKEVTIPSNVSNIGDNVFNGCSNLSNINVDEKNLYYSSSDGVLYDKNMTTIIRCPEGKNGMYTIPDGVTYISKSAFCDCAGLTSISIPNSVINIGSRSFYGCIGLTSVSVSSSVESVGAYAFNHCDSLTEITWNAKKATGFSSSDYVFDYAGQNGSGINVVFGEEVESIPAYLFYPSGFGANPNIVSLTIGKNVKKIESYAFRYFTTLQDVYYGGTSLEWDSVKWAGIKFDDDVTLHCVDIYDIVGIISPECDVETNADGIITKILVPNSTSSVTLDLRVSYGATWQMYRTNSYTTENTDKTINGLVAGNDTRKAYIRVTAADGTTTKDYIITVYRKTKATDPVITINGSKVTITSGSGKIYYTTDGSEPTESSNLYTGTFIGLSDAVIKAVVIDSTKDEWSNIATKTVPTYITTTLEADYVTADSNSNSLYFGFVISSDGEPTGTFIVAVYDDSDRMIGCKTIDITTATDYVENSFSYIGTPHTYKAFFWSSLGDLVPLCECIDGNVE